ncbi:hypothetical protein F8388_019566 [Cannabis sativa]|uniref:RNase H type-1 domain-containing protein n=1 Tax=Cannabis sativa TaxID=3483 RepID=A0A7J6E8F4_CANSA|nr:hypothetical protein G4B88_029193 [Cannabis sativa]KAF4369341.1 hypothetical protein F8388_019566 [Cannabis sativa]
MSLGMLYIWRVMGLLVNTWVFLIVWAGLLWGRQLLKRGLAWKIGSGNSIPLSASNWIHDISSPTILHPIDSSLSLVSFFINSDNTWNDTPTLYVDAALDQDRCITGLGCVFKVGSHRIIDSAKIQKPGASSPIFAEAQALYHGLSWCLSSQLMPSFIFSDCLNLVSKVNGTWKDNSAISSLVA